MSTTQYFISAVIASSGRKIDGQKTEPRKEGWISEVIDIGRPIVSISDIRMLEESMEQEYPHVAGAHVNIVSLFPLGDSEIDVRIKALEIQVQSLVRILDETLRAFGDRERDSKTSMERRGS